MSLERLVRNYLKMTPGSFAGGAKSTTPVRSETLGALRRPPAGTFSGEARTATPVGCNRPVSRMTSNTAGPVEGFVYPTTAMATGTAYNPTGVRGTTGAATVATATGTAYQPALPIGLTELTGTEYTYVELNLLPTTPEFDAAEYVYVERDDTIEFVAIGARNPSDGVVLTTTLPYPTGVAAGRVAIAFRTIKPDTATSPSESGWTQQISVTGGTGSAAADVGATRAVVDTRILDGAETGSVVFDQASSPDSVCGAILIYKNDTGLWTISTTSGDDTTHGTGRSATSASVTVAKGDMIVACVALDTDDATAFTSPSITGAGATFEPATIRQNAGGVTTGFDSGTAVFEAVCNSGGTGTLSFTATGGPSNCGATVFVILRQVWFVPQTATATGTAYNAYGDGDDNLMVTEDGDNMLTEDGNNMATEVL